MTFRWYDDRDVVRSLPARFKGLAWYWRWMAQPGGLVPGGSFIFRRLRDASRVLRMRDTAVARIGPYRVHIDLLDQRSLKVLSELGDDDSLEFRVLRALLPVGATFIDLGANHGSFSIRAAALVGREGLVVAVEPNPRLAQLLRGSLEATGVPNTLHAVALGVTCGKVNLHVPSDSSGSSSVFANYHAGKRHTVEVPLTTGDDLFGDVRADRPCVVKLDVEGAELSVIRGSTGFLKRVRPVILWELNPASAGVAEGLEALLAAFVGAGYNRFAELSAWPATVPAAEVAFTPERNLLAIPG